MKTKYIAIVLSGLCFYVGCVSTGNVSNSANGAPSNKTATTANSSTQQPVAGNSEVKTEDKKITVSSGDKTITVENSDGGKTVIVSDDGKTTIEEEENSEQKGDIFVDGINKRLGFNCKGRSAVVEGNKNTVTLRGECKQLTVSGNDNVVTVETVAVINASGNKNRVTWSKGANNQKPKINVSGNDTTVNQAGQ